MIPTHALLVLYSTTRAESDEASEVPQRQRPNAEWSILGLRAHVGLLLDMTYDLDAVCAHFLSCAADKSAISETLQ